MKDFIEQIAAIIAARSGEKFTGKLSIDFNFTQGAIGSVDINQGWTLKKESSKDCKPGKDGLNLSRGVEQSGSSLGS